MNKFLVSFAVINDFHSHSHPGSIYVNSSNTRLNEDEIETILEELRTYASNENSSDVKYVITNIYRLGED